MTRKRKAVRPVWPANQGKTASDTTAVQNTIPKTTRQRIKQAIVCAGCKGLLPARLVCWLLRKGGLTHV